MRELGMLEYALRIVKRQFILAFRSPSEFVIPISFFIMVLALFPLGFGPVVKNSGVIWIVALLASLLSSDRIFRQDYDDGSLDQLLLSPQSLFGSSLAYIFVHWSQTGLPLALISPLVAVMFDLPASAILALLVSLLIGTIVLSLIGAIGAALTVGLRKGGALVSLIILPLYIPVLIFGKASVEAGIQGSFFSPPLALLAALACGAVAFAPFAIGAGLRISVEI